MPGFRPGKVPTNLIRKMHGEALQADALNSTVQDSVQSLIARQGPAPRHVAVGRADRRLCPWQGCRSQGRSEVLPEVPEASRPKA
jgi:trigger factor